MKKLCLGSLIAVLSYFLTFAVFAGTSQIRSSLFNFQTMPQTNNYFYYCNTTNFQLAGSFTTGTLDTNGGFSSYNNESCSFVTYFNPPNTSYNSQFGFQPYGSPFTYTSLNNWQKVVIGTDCTYENLNNISNTGKSVLAIIQIGSINPIMDMSNSYYLLAFQLMLGGTENNIHVYVSNPYAIIEPSGNLIELDNTTLSNGGYSFNLPLYNLNNKLYNLTFELTPGQNIPELNDTYSLFNLKLVNAVPLN